MHAERNLRTAFVVPVLASLVGLSVVLGVPGFGVPGPGGRPAVYAQDEGADADAAGDQTWVLDFKPVKMRMITPRSGPSKGRTYWYLIYTLENKTGEDRDAFVSLSAEADRGKQYADVYLPDVEEAIEAAEERPLWGKTDELAQFTERDPADEKFSYTGLKSGEKRTCVAIFNRLAATSKKFKIRVRGLSDELNAVRSEDGTYFSVTERVRVLHVERPGDEYEVTNDSFERLRAEWVKESIRVEYPSNL